MLRSRLARTHSPPTQTPAGSSGSHVELSNLHFHNWLPYFLQFTKQYYWFHWLCNNSVSEWEDNILYAPVCAGVNVLIFR